MSEVLASYAMEPPVFDDDNMEVVSDTAGLYDNPDDIDIDIDIIQEGADQDNDVVVEDASVTGSDHIDMVDDIKEQSPDADMVDGETQEHHAEQPPQQEAEYQFVNDTFDHEQQSFEMEEDFEEDIDAPIPGTSIIEPNSPSTKQAEQSSELPPISQPETKESPIKTHQEDMKSAPEELPAPETEATESLDDETAEPKNVTKQEKPQTEDVQSPAGSHPEQQEPDLPAPHNVDGTATVTQETTREATENAEELTALPDVKVLYQGSEISLFPPKEDDPSNIFFIEDEALAHEPISHLLDACRTVLADHITEEEELSFGVESLNLHLTEGTAQYASFSLSQIIQVYLDFAHNDGIEHPGSLYISISTNPTPDATFNDLVEAARAGKGLSEIGEWEEAENLEEDEGSETKYAEDQVGSVEREVIHDQGEEQNYENQQEPASDYVDEKEKNEEEQPEQARQVDDQGREEQQEQPGATVSAEEEPRDGRTITETFENAEQRPTEEHWEGDEGYEPGVESFAAEDDGNNSQQVTAPESPNLADNEADKEPNVEVLESAVPPENEVDGKEDVDNSQIIPHEEVENDFENDETSVTVGGSKDVSASPTPADEASATLAESLAVENAEQGIVQQNTNGGFLEAEDDIYEAIIEGSPTLEEDQAVGETYSAIEDEITVTNDTNSFKPTTDTSFAYDESKQHDTGLTVYDDENFEIDLSDPNAAESNNQVFNTGQEVGLDEFADIAEHEYNLIDENDDVAVDAQMPRTGTPEPAHNLLEIDEGLFKSPVAKPQHPVVAINDQQSKVQEGSRIPVVDSSREPTPEDGIFNGNEEFDEAAGEGSEVTDQFHNGYVFQEESPNHSKRPRAEDEPGVLSESVPVTKRRRSE